MTESRKICLLITAGIGLYALAEYSPFHRANPFICLALWAVSLWFLSVMRGGRHLEEIEEITDTLPTALGRWMLRTKWINSLIFKVTHKGIKIQTSSLWGFTVLYFLSRLRPLRRRSLRFGLEQTRIDGWIDQVCAIAPNDPALACEIVETQQLVKGYGDTHANGMRNFTAIMDVLPSVSGNPDAAATIASLRSAALADENGHALQAALDALPH